MLTATSPRSFDPGEVSLWATHLLQYGTYSPSPSHQSPGPNDDLAKMPLPLLLVPLAVAGGSAIAQAVAKLRTHSRLNALRDELEQLESDHRDEVLRHYDRQTQLCRQLGRPEPELPPVLREAEQPETAAPSPPRWRRLLRRRSTTVADGSTRTRSGIVGRHGASFAAGTVWRMLSQPVLNVARPLSARLLTFAPQFASVGGAGGSIAASTGLRFALGAVTAVGIILGPALAVWSISSEIRSVRRARRELETTRLQREAELANYAARTWRLQQQLAAIQPAAATSS